VRPSANSKDRLFLREVIARNVPSLRASKHAMQEGVGATDYYNTWSEVDNKRDVMDVVKSLIRDKVFDTVLGRGFSQEGVGRVKEWEDLFQTGDTVLSEGNSIKKYLSKARYQWDSNIGLPMDGNNLDNDDEWDDELQPDDDVLDSVEGRINEPGVNEDEESEEF